MMVRFPSITCFFSWWERTPQGKEDDDDFFVNVRLPLTKHLS